MKKYIYLAFFIFFAINAPNMHAQTPSNTVTSTSSSATTAPIDESEMKKVKKIIDLVASKSADEKLAFKIGILGTVTQSTNTALTVQTINGVSKIIDIDEITKFSDPDSKSYGISDIKKGDLLGIIGIINKISNHILGRHVSRMSNIPTYFEGIITEINKKNFQFTANSEKGDKKIIDITTSTKISSFSKPEGEFKSGFTKVEIGQRIHAVGFPDEKVENQINTTRFIHFEDLPPSIKMKNNLNITPTGQYPSVTSNP